MSLDYVKNYLNNNMQTMIKLLKMISTGVNCTITKCSIDDYLIKWAIFLALLEPIAESV